MPFERPATVNEPSDKFPAQSFAVRDGSKTLDFDLSALAIDGSWTFPAPAAGDAGKVLFGDGTWQSIPGGGDMLGSNNLSDLSDLQEAKDNLNIAISDVTNLQTTLDGKAAISHAHAISDVTNLQTTLDGKAATSHAHAISDVTNLQTTLDGKAATSHSHAISDVTNLQTSLDAKVNAANPSTTGIFTHTGGANEDATFNVNNNGRFRVTIDDTGRSAGWQNAVFTTRFDAANTNQVGVQADFTHTTGNASSTNFFTPLASSFGGLNKANFLVSYNPFGTWTNSTDVKGKLRFHVSDNVGISFGSDTSSGNRRFFFGSWSQEFGIIVPNGTNYDITIPSSQGAAGTVLTNDGSGGCSWAAAGGGVTGFTGSQNTSSPNNTVNASQLLVSASSTNADFVVQPKGTGAILAQLPDSTATGGNKRGVRSVDLQMARGTATQVVSGSDSFTVGNSNTVAAQYSGAIGYNNNINGSASYAFAAGSSNTAGSGFTVAMGYNNTATGQAAVSIGYSNTNSGTTGIAIGQSNTVSGTCSVAIGQQLTANGSYSVATNFNNDVNAKNYSFIMLRGGRAQNDYTLTIGSYRSTTGDGQAVIKMLHAATTDATPTNMTGSGGSATYAFPANRNVSVIATIQGMTSTGNGGMFVRQALFSRTLAAQIGTTQTIGTDIVSGALSGISVALSYSSGNLNVAVTGLAATNIQWLCKLEVTELQYS